MDIKKSLPTTAFTKISNSIFTMGSLSDGAFRLYCLYASLPNGSSTNEEGTAAQLGITARVLTRRRKELRELGLIKMVQIGTKVRYMYLGYPGYSADRVEMVWDNKDWGDSAKAKYDITGNLIS